MSRPEFSRPVDIRQAGTSELRLQASEAERSALAERFGLVRIDRLEAQVSLEREDSVVDASGKLVAEFIQSCAVSAQDLPVAVNEELSFRFIPASEADQAVEEVEIDPEDCDEIEYSGTSFDLGEALAQSLALTIDPFAIGPGAKEARARAGIGTPEDSGPFAALKGLKLKD